MAPKKCPQTKICVHMWQKLDVLEKIQKNSRVHFSKIENIHKFLRITSLLASQIQVETWDKGTTSSLNLLSHLSMRTMTLDIK